MVPGASGSIFMNKDLGIAIEHRLGREKNVGPEDAVEFLLVKFARGPGRRAQIDRDHRLVEQNESAEPESMRDRDAAETAIDAERDGSLEVPGSGDIPKCARREAEIALTGAPESTPSRAGLPLISARTRR